MNKKQIIEMVKTNNVSHIIDLQFLDMTKHKNTLKNKSQRNGLEPIYDTRLMFCMTEDFLQENLNIAVEKLNSKGVEVYMKETNEMIGDLFWIMEEYQNGTTKVKDDWTNVLMRFFTEYYCLAYPFRPQLDTQDSEYQKDKITLMSFWANNDLGQMRLNPISYDNETLCMKDAETECLTKNGIIEHINTNYSITDTFGIGLTNKEFN